jgi:hypothetical protein
LKSAPFWAADLATGSVLLAFLLVELAEEQSPARRALARVLVTHSRRGPPAEAPPATD